MNTKKDGKKTKVEPYAGLMDPKVDYVFKMLFGNEKYPVLSISFLNAVFGYSDKGGAHKRITSIKIENPNINRTMIEDKYSILDIRATLSTGEIINIEIQVKSPGSMTSRLLYYLSKMFGGQLCEGEDYDKLKKCISIAVLDFNLIELESKDFHNKFTFRNQDNLLLSDSMEVHTIELPKLAKQINLDKNDLLVDWLLFISNPEGEETKKLQAKVPEIKQAMEVLEMLSHDKNAREIYEKRQQSLHDKTSALNHERRSAQQEIAIEMLREGMNLNIIAKCTHLLLEEVQELQRKISH